MTFLRQLFKLIPPAKYAVGDTVIVTMGERITAERTIESRRCYRGGANGYYWMYRLRGHPQEEFSDSILALPIAGPHCVVCGEDDSSVILECRDGIVRCAHHANEAGYCWGCGDGEPRYYDSAEADGLCYDCKSADDMAWRRR